MDQTSWEKCGYGTEVLKKDFNIIYKKGKLMPEKKIWGKFTVSRKVIIQVKTRFFYLFVTLK